MFGGGLAGCATAARLAGAGRSVEGVHRELGTRRPPEETVVQTARPLLAAFELADEAARRWPGTARHAVIWGSDEVRWRDRTDEAPGFKVVRRELDSILMDRATDAGVRWTDHAGVEAATIEILATGKSAVGSRDSRVVDALPATVALWTRVDPPPGWADATVIEAVPEGWWWWLPLSDGRASVALLCDAAELSGTGRSALWASARRHAVGPAREVECAPDAAVVATPRRREADASFLVGDAASTIDPLSSQGVEKALSSADEVFHTVNTALTLPDRMPQLLEHNRAWERALFEAHALRALSWYAKETRFTTAPFWSRRAAELSERTPPDVGPLPRRFAPSPRLEPALMWRRGGDGLLTSSSGMRLPGGLALDRIGDVMIEPLLALTEDGPDLKMVIQRAKDRPEFFLLSPGLIDAALTDLHRRGFLVAR